MYCRRNTDVCVFFALILQINFIDLRAAINHLSSLLLLYTGKIYTGLPIEVSHHKLINDRMKSYLKPAD